MNKIFTLIALSLFTIQSKAQSLNTSSKTDTVVKAPAIAVKEDQPYGRIDTADLELKNCDFEKDANAMVLFDKATVTFDAFGRITFIRHKRIKIFNDEGKNEANISIPYIDGMYDIDAETVNLNGKKIEYIPVDDDLIYKEKISKYRRSLTFTFPAVKPGSVIEFKYKWITNSYTLQAWAFQSEIPERYSELDINIAKEDHISIVFMVNQGFSKKIDADTSYLGSRKIRALSNVNSFKPEPYIPPIENNVQRAMFKPENYSWTSVSSNAMNDKDFGWQMDQKLSDEKAIIARVDLIKDKKSKIDFIYNTVKNRVAWNKKDSWSTTVGVQKAWDKGTGNSAEINLILYHLLMQAKIGAYPMIVSTRGYGIIDPVVPDPSQFNRMVVYVPHDSTKYYILDATGKYNKYDEVPSELLSSWALIISPTKGKNALFNILCDTSTTQLIDIHGTIKPEGTMSGTVDITNDGYDRVNSLMLYDELGEQKYIDDLTGADNNFKITSLKLENEKSDTTALTQHMNFDLNLAASDQNYIYFNPHLFTSLGANPFLSKDRYSNIDFSYGRKLYITGVFKIPDGYKLDVLPQNQALTTGDKGMSFTRIAAMQDGEIVIRYVITRKRTTYTKEEYPALYEFYKKMFEMLNEQIVLKKA